MSTIFTNFDITPENYIPNNTIEPKSTPLNPKIPYVLYNGKNDAIGLTWNYGDTVYLEFDTSGNVVYGEEDQLEGVTEDAETYLKGKMFKILVLNFRYEVVAYCNIKAAPIVRVLSDSFYPKTLVKGTYKLRLDIVDKEGHTINTLISPEDCVLHIK